MPSSPTDERARCVHCHEDVAVGKAYAHGDHIKCGACGTNHKVVRGDRLRLVLADVGPLREALAQNQQLVNRLEAELAHARGSFGIGANGIGIGLIFALYQVGWKGAAIDASLLGNAIGIAIITGLLLELANWSFLAKRQAMIRIAAELAEARGEGARLRQVIRDSTRL
jgi:hypothetical protein